MMAISAILAAIFALATGTALAFPAPQYRLALDGDAVWSGRDAAKAGSAIVHGRADWVDGVAGKALAVRRQAYDQATALVGEPLPGVSTRAGTIAFWFRPDWDEKDGEGHRMLTVRDIKGRPFRFLLSKWTNGTFEISLFTPTQVQILKKDVFRKGEWTHIAFSWNAADGSLRLYIDGKLLERKAAPDAFANVPETIDAHLECGEGTDRFTAKVGDGAYDEIRIYDATLSDYDVFDLAHNSESVAMRPVAPPRAGEAIRLSHSEPFLATPAPLLRFATADGASFTLTALGPSKGIALSGSASTASGVVLGADTLDLRAGYELRFEPRGRSLVFLLDGAEQGRIDLNRDVGDIVSMEVAEGVTVGNEKWKMENGKWVASASDGNEQWKMGNGKWDAPASAAEMRLWSLNDAARSTNGVRRAVSLNGYWRVWPVDDYTGGPPAEVAPGYGRVPGSFRSPLWNIHRLGRGGALDAGAQTWQGRALDSYRAAWYERDIAVAPSAGTGGRLWLVFGHFNADVGRIYWNGELVESFRQDFKSFAMVPHSVRVDVTDRLSPNGHNRLRLYVDRHYTALWKGRPSISDHAEICLGDVWLERTPSPLHLVSALALPKWRGGKTVTIRARIGNPAREKGSVMVRAVFSRSTPEDGRTFERVVTLTGEEEQLVLWTEPWPEAVPWSAEAPETYALDISLLRSVEVADTLPRQLFGFREAWAENGELWLNGVHLRLRMWSNPAIQRLRQWWGHPEAVEQYVAHPKELGYNAVRNEPFNKGTIVAEEPYLDACDRMGLYNLYPMPPYEDEPKDLYAREVERFFEAWGSHPSILMWYTDFNTCGYPWGQDPAKLTDADYFPPHKGPARARAHFAEETMRALDPSRELFQHAGASSGRIFGSMNYQSYGTPLQEQADWPAQWARGHRQPLMVVESAFPYPGQFSRFDGSGDEEHLGAEQAARYFGPSVFAAERFPVPHSAPLLWNTDVATGEDPNMLRLSGLHYRRVIPAWRAYGVSAIGDYPGGRDHMRTIHMFANHRVVWRAGGDPKTPGLKPENADGQSETQRHLLGDYSRPAYLHDTVKACFAPLLVFAGGDPDDFTNRDHEFFVGESFRKSLVAVNDHLYPVTVDYSWTCAGQSGSGRIDVEAGGIVREPIELKAPDVAEKTDAILAVEWRFRDATGEETKGIDSLALRFFPREDLTQRHRDAEAQSRGALGSPRTSRTPREVPGEQQPLRSLREESGADEPSALRQSPRTPREVLTQRHRDTEAQSQAAHETPRTPRTPREISSPPLCVYDPRGKTTGLLQRAGVVFEQVSSLDDLPPTELLIVGQGAFADSPLDGDLPLCVANAIVFEQPTNALKRFIMSAPSCRDAFATRLGSPYLVGLDDEDLHDWRGASDTVPAFILSAENSPHYPRSKWKCGNGGIVSGCAIRRPSRGNFRTIVSCGFNLENAALLEERRDGGRTLWCQMDVTSRYGKDPAATRIVDNILVEFAVRSSQFAVGEPEDPKLRKPENPLGADLRAARDVFYLGSPADAQTLALAGASLPPWDGASRGTVLVLPGADLSRLPFAYHRSRGLDFRAAVPDDPVFAGVSPADLYFRNANDLLTPAFDVRREGDTTFVFLGIAPGSSVKGLWNDEKIMRVWTTVLDNLGVCMTPETPYIPDLDLYDGDAFHNW